MPRPTTIVNLQADNPFLQHIKAVVYSHPGEGKTVFAGSSSKVGKTLIMDGDGTGALSARSLGSTAELAPIRDYRQLDDVYQYLRYDDHGYEWVWWDSITLFQRRALMDDIMAQTIADNPRREDKMGAWVPDKREYGINMNRLMQYVRLFMDLPMNVGVTAHLTTQVEPDNTTIYMPDVQGRGMPGSLCGYANLVGCLTKATQDGKLTQRLITRRAGKFYAKDQFNALGSHVDQPSVPRIMQIINNTKGTK